MKEQGLQPPLPRMLKCGWNDCPNDAVCALRNKELGVIVNTCYEHYTIVTGKEFTSPTQQDE